MLFDTHCHLNSDELYSNIDEVITNAMLEGVRFFLVVGYDMKSSLRAIEIAREYENCYAAIGIHPTEIDNVTEDEFEHLMCLAVPQNKVVAIGEIGLDYHWVKDDEQRKKQKEWFIKQINYANILNLPICIHNRESTEDCMKILRAIKPNKGLVMHCYSSSVEIMEELTKWDDAYISLGGPVTFKNAVTPKEVAKKVPIDRLLIETDCPYLAPHPYRGKTNEPKYVKLVLEEIASLRNMDPSELGEITTDNAKRLFKI